MTSFFLVLVKPYPKIGKSVILRNIPALPPPTPCPKYPTPSTHCPGCYGCPGFSVTQNGLGASPPVLY